VWTDRLRKVLVSRLTNLPTSDLTDALASSAAGSFQGMHQHAYAPSAMDASNTTVDTKPMSAVLAALDANHLTVHVPSSLKGENAAVPSIIDYWITSEFEPAPVSGFIALV
jgi:hypothetical protein